MVHWQFALLALVMFGGIAFLLEKYPKTTQNVCLWEILVPASNKDKEFTFEHHKKWDEYVKSIAGGLTIMRTAKGEWISPDGQLFIDRMIPVKIKCTSNEIMKIIDFTMIHYDQLAVLAYKVSNEVIIKHR